MERPRENSIRCRNDFDEISSSDLDGGDFVGRETDEVGELRGTRREGEGEEESERGERQEDEGKREGGEGKEGDGKERTRVV